MYTHNVERQKVVKETQIKREKERERVREEGREGGEEERKREGEGQHKQREDTCQIQVESVLHVSSLLLRDHLLYNVRHGSTAPPSPTSADNTLRDKDDVLPVAAILDRSPAAHTRLLLLCWLSRASRRLYQAS